MKWKKKIEDDGEQKIHFVQINQVTVDVHQISNCIQSSADFVGSG